MYRKRKTEIAERRFFPDRIRRRDVLVSDYLVENTAEHVTSRLRNAKHYDDAPLLAPLAGAPARRRSASERAQRRVA